MFILTARFFCPNLELLSTSLNTNYHYYFSGLSLSVHDILMETFIQRVDMTNLLLLVTHFFQDFSEGSELLENLEEMYPQYYLDSDVIFKHTLVCSLL